jgi:AraC-like DNA-binding protein
MLNTRLTENTTEDILEEMLTLARSDFPLPCDCLRAVQAHQVKKYEVEGATLSFPLEGDFSYKENDDWHRVGPGEMLIIPNSRSIDVRYAPSEKSGEFVALSVVLTEEQLEAARLLLSAPPPPETGSIASVSLEGLLAPLTRWTQAMQEGKKTLSLHAMLEVVLLLYAMGHHALLRAQPPSLAMRIRRKVINDPAHNWSASEIESLMGLSGATLRRHLASESTNLRSVIADARMSEALKLLMTSTLPVKTVALRVGYNSLASFSKQFIERYSLEPSAFR